MKLSIITVNLNNRDGLKKTIDSVLSQTFRDFEWIVIDGGSTDGSRELIEEYSDHFSFWCSEPDKGIYNAMNKGVAHANGEYCQFLNSGDWLAGETILYDIATSLKDCDILYGDIDFFRSGLLQKHISYPDHLSFDDLYYGSIGHNASFIRTDLLRDTPYDEQLKIVSDWKFFFVMFMKRRSFVHINKGIGCFDMNGISETNHSLLNTERQQTITDLRESLAKYLMEQKSLVESHLANTRTDDFCLLCNRHRLLSKCITALVMLMRKLK